MDLTDLIITTSDITKLHVSLFIFFNLMERVIFNLMGNDILR